MNLIPGVGAAASIVKFAAAGALIVGLASLGSCALDRIARTDRAEAAAERQSNAMTTLRRSGDAQAAEMARGRARMAALRARNASLEQRLKARKPDATACPAECTIRLKDGK